jgi:hypothetical protein
MQLSGKSALIANPIQALQEFYVNEATDENEFNTVALARLVKQQKNSFPKYIEQALEIEGIECPDLSSIPSLNSAKGQYNELN